MRFLWPVLLWLLLLLPALVAAYVHLLGRRRKAAIAYPSLALARAAIGPGQRLRRHLPPALYLLGLACALLAAARPVATLTLPSGSLTLVLAIDVSRSMLAADVPPTRIQAAQDAARHFIARLPGDARLGIVSFAGTAAVVQPPTRDRRSLDDAIGRFQLQRGTATGSGLLLALSVLFPEDGLDLEAALFPPWPGQGLRHPAPLGQHAPAAPPRPEVAPGSETSVAIILLSDGRRTHGPDPLRVARLAAERGVRVHTVGFGTEKGALIGDENWSFFARLDEATLRAVAELTHGEYFHAASAADLTAVYDHLNARFVLERRHAEIGALFAAAAVLLLAAAAGLSMLWFPAPAAARAPD